MALVSPIYCYSSNSLLQEIGCSWYKNQHLLKCLEKICSTMSASVTTSLFASRWQPYCFRMHVSIQRSLNNRACILDLVFLWLGHTFFQQQTSSHIQGTFCFTSTSNFLSHWYTHCFILAANALWKTGFTMLRNNCGIVVVYFLRCVL